MHKLTTMAKDPSFRTMFNKYVDLEIVRMIEGYVDLYNGAETEKEKYQWFMKAISNLPCGMEMWMTITSNYLSLKTIVKQRINHKLGDWRVFCKWALELPMFRELTGITEEVILLD
jgi:hypothetical protein